MDDLDRPAVPDATPERLTDGPVRRDLAASVGVVGALVLVAALTSMLSHL